MAIRRVLLHKALWLPVAASLWLPLIVDTLLKFLLLPLHVACLELSHTVTVQHGQGLLLHISILRKDQAFHLRHCFRLQRWLRGPSARHTTGRIWVWILGTCIAACICNLHTPGVRWETKRLEFRETTKLSNLVCPVAKQPKRPF